MKMTAHEITLVATIAGVLLLGATVKHFRDLHRMTHPPASMIATPKEKLARPLYVSDKRR
jgi:hypothetical protein